ncbi:MAG TPA: fused MFS/spermidine synthase [Bryobacteraceae bacterium]|nr:fused MFS/spermidine synthase [Bryobacteraceae bacterium]
MWQRSHAIRLPATIFLSAFLLFQVQPMMGRFVLPWFGGGPAVWTNCLLFFQAFLLAGYAYAHWLGSRPSLRTQAFIHIGLLAASLLLLPIIPRADLWKPASASDPSGRILLLLTVTVGAPYLLLSSTGPLLQRWFALSQPEKSPWRLYALSNFGSFLALFSYPFALEPYLRLHTQAWIWSALYAAFAILCGWTAWSLHDRVLKSAAPAESERTVDPTSWTLLFWLALAMCGSTLLLATTNQISQEIAVVPFLWVAPLSIYLLTFILAFEHPRWYRRSFFAIAAGILGPAACAVQVAAIGLSARIQIGIYLLTLFVLCMVCHGELARARPATRHLTGFYLAVAAGGALGGVFVALIAPHVFTEFTEYPIGLAAACLLGFAGWLMSGALKLWTSKNFAVRIPLMALLVGGATSVVAIATNNNQAIATVRNFYGILRVKESLDSNGALRMLTHGTIRHGFQYLRGPKTGWPTSYYGPHSGAGIVLAALEKTGRRVAVIGLGTGTMAAWGRAGDTFRFYEINPAVQNIATTWFSYLKNSRARTEVILGDARVQMERELAAGQSHDFDVIAVDAFSSDAIPLHLLTTECADTYRARLVPNGLLLLHVSNRLLNLEPVARGLARHLGWKAATFESGDEVETGESTATWVLITGNSEIFTHPGMSQEVSWTGKNREPITWTDDFASLWHVLKF